MTTQFREASGECLESNAPGAAFANGAAYMDSCQNVSGQKWRAVPEGNGYYRLTTEYREGANECLESNAMGGTAAGGGPYMDPCLDVSGQLWRAVPLGNGYYNLTSQYREGANECLEGNQAGGSQSGAAYMDICQNVTGQMWKFLPEVPAPVQVAPQPVQIAPPPVQVAPQPVQIAPPPVQATGGFPTGYFKMTSEYRETAGECLEGNEAGGFTAGGAAFMDNCQNVSGQLWRATPEGNGYYRLTTQFREPAGECLEGNQLNGSTLGGAAFMDTCQNVSGQLWKAFPDGRGYFKLTTQFREAAGECLEGSRLGEPFLGGAAYMDSCEDVSGQFWKFLPAQLATRLVNPTAASIAQQLTGGGIANLAINFDLDSDRLTPQAQGVVAMLAQAIYQAGLQNATLEIQGHTDASGNPDYNMGLSLRRAMAVLNELAIVHGIRAQMIPVGYGESRLFDRVNPGSPLNRRVEVYVR